ncbi:MAG: phosphotransferase [Lachnospiraceae bacterium]|nr:phosphotransferase [Lachnospiraceae bacterium]
MKENRISLPPAIGKRLAGRELVEITENHVSGDLVYRVGNEYILKISEQEERLKREQTVNDFLAGRLPVSETVLFEIEAGRAFYLKTMLQGENLAEKKYLADPRELVRLLAQAMEMIHGVETGGCPMKNPDSEGDCFIHGDFCLPNILVKDGKVSGFIDTEAAGIGDPWMDYAWCIWSLEYNLGTSLYTGLLLDTLGIEFDREKYERYTSQD